MKAKWRIRPSPYTVDWYWLERYVPTWWGLSGDWEKEDDDWDIEKLKQRITKIEAWESKEFIYIE